MCSEDDRRKIDGEKAEEDVGSWMIIVRCETVRCCDGVEIRIVEVADICWGDRMKYEAVDVILEDLEGVSCS